MGLENLHKSYYTFFGKRGENVVKRKKFVFGEGEEVQ